MVSVMETRTIAVPAAPDGAGSPSLAEELPGLYRAILDRVAELEAIGARGEAARIRMSATEVYSDAWDAAGRKRLQVLLARADRAMGGRPKDWPLRRRSVAPR
jgi:hypothetical protein